MICVAYLFLRKTVPLRSASGWLHKDSLSVFHTSYDSLRHNLNTNLHIHILCSFQSSILITTIKTFNVFINCKERFFYFYLLIKILFLVIINLRKKKTNISKLWYLLVLNNLPFKRFLEQNRFLIQIQYLKTNKTN